MCKSHTYVDKELKTDMNLWESNRLSCACPWYISWNIVSLTVKYSGIHTEEKIPYLVLNSFDAQNLMRFYCKDIRIATNMM